MYKRRPVRSIDTAGNPYWIGLAAGAQAALALRVGDTFWPAALTFRKLFPCHSLKSPFARGFADGFNELTKGLKTGSNRRITAI